MIAFVGIGNMGLCVMAAQLAKGKSIIGYDINSDKIQKLQNKTFQLDEDGLVEIIYSDNSDIRFSDQLQDIKDCNVFFIGVETPEINGEVSYSSLHKALGAISEVAPEGASIVIGSTLFGNSYQKIREVTRNDLHLIYNPVFLRVGTGISDYDFPAKCIFGFEDPENIPTSFKEWHENTNFGKYMKLTAWKNAEWIKLVHNIFMTTKLSFANELGMLLDEYNLEPKEIFDLCFDETPNGRLLTKSHLMPGVPYSGPCLPKDAKIYQTIIDKSKYYEPIYKTGIGTALLQSNENYKDFLYHNWTKDCESGDTLGLIGLTMRKDADEFRHSVGLEFALRAIADGFQIKIHDRNLSGLSPEELITKARADEEALKAVPHIVADKAEIEACKKKIDFENFSFHQNED